MSKYYIRRIRGGSGGSFRLYSLREPSPDKEMSKYSIFEYGLEKAYELALKDKTIMESLDE